MVRSEKCNTVNFKVYCLGLVFFLTFFVSPVVFAESNWYTCSVDLTGPGKIETFVVLTDQAETPAFVYKWFLFPQKRFREMLAVTLSAINSDKKVLVVVDPDSATYPVISEIFIQAK